MRKILGIFVFMILCSAVLYGAIIPSYRPSANSFENAVISGNAQDVDFYIQKMKPEARKTILNKSIEKRKEAKVATPLVYAVNQNNLALMKVLVENGADVNLKSGGRSPFAVAARLGSREILEYFVQTEMLSKESYDNALLEAAGDFIAIPSGRAPQREPKEARNSGNTEMFKYLAQNGADIKKNEADLFVRVIDNNNIELLKFLIDSGADVNARTSFGNATPVFSAVMRNNLEAVKILHENGADLNAANDSGVTPVFVAVAYEKDEAVQKLRLDMLRYLVNAGANINTADKSGATPLSKACYLQNFDTIKFLVERGADVNAPDVLPFAVQKKGVGLLSYLTEHGADAKTKSGAFALLTAVNAENNEAVRFLKEKGADASMADSGLPEKYKRFKEEFTMIQVTSDY